MDKPINLPKINFNHFLEKFPEVDLPITLGEETHHVFSNQNDPLPVAMIEQFILPIEEEPADDYTEFVPCMKIANTGDFYAIIYWRAGLLNYQYRLATFTKKGEYIDKRIIAGTFSDGEALTTSVATIDEEWAIFVASGRSGDSLLAYDAASSTAYQLELLPDGKIINS